MCRHIIFPSLSLTCTHIHTRMVCSSSPPLCLASPSKTPLLLFAWCCDQCSSELELPTLEVPQTLTKLMKTSETVPGPLASTHNVPNHMLLLTPKCSLLIGTIVEILITPAGSPKMLRCEVPLYKHGVC